MRTAFLVALLGLMISEAAAQPQPQQAQVSPSELAITISSNVNSLATALENALRQVRTLSEQNAALQKKLDDKEKK